MLRNLLGTMRTVTVVQVVAVAPGAVGPVGYVDVLPLINQIDSAGNSQPHGVIYNLPYFRLQGSQSAVIIDPAVGDIGIAVFSDRDMSSVVANRAAKNPQSNPGSRRRFDMADGIYIGGILNGTPLQYVQFLPNNGGINLVSPGTVYINGRDVFIHATESYSQDVNGYGSRLTYLGGGLYLQETWYTGATVNSDPDHGWSPPSIPMPS